MQETRNIPNRWQFPEPQAQRDARSACRDMARQLGVHPLVAMLLHRRQVTQFDLAHSFLHPRLTDLHDPALLPGAIEAANRLAQAVRQGQPIVVYGDYDVDGITASAILWHMLRAAGATVDTYVPHRIDEGYGLNPQAIKQLAKDQPVIVSVDCGITASESALVARTAGVDLIITDHHELPSDSQGLPDAYALVHPRLEGSAYPFGALCGAGVAFKLAWQFARTHCGSDRLPDEFRGLLLDLLAFAALGTIADVVPLVEENRVITSHGLGRIKQTRFLGLNALIDAARLGDEKIDTYHVGFVLAPRINACGRMGHAAQAVQLLTAADHDESQQIARFLTKENERRRSTERAIFQQAKALTIEKGFDRDDCRVIVLGNDDWHPGVIGIVASRLVDTFARPVVMLSYQNGQAHGSARSVPGLSMHQALEHCAPMLDRFGGHAMAAGLKMQTQRVDAFREAMIGFVNDRLSPDDLTHQLDIDATCSLEELSIELFDQIHRLAPFGCANPRPVLCAQGVTLEQPAQRMGQSGQHMRMLLRAGRRVWPAVAFGQGDRTPQLPAGAMVDVAFEPKISNWQNRRRPEIHIKDFRHQSVVAS